MIPADIKSIHNSSLADMLHILRVITANISFILTYFLYKDEGQSDENKISNLYKPAIYARWVSALIEVTHANSFEPVISQYFI